MKLNKFVIALLTTVFAISCNQTGGFKTTPDGMQYKINTPVKGDRIKVGDAVTFRVSITPDNGGEPIYSSEKNGKDEYMVLTEQLKDNEIAKALMLMTSGEKATFKIPIESMIKNMPMDPFLRNYIRKGGMVIYDIEVTKVDLKEKMEKEKLEKMQKQNAIEAPLIDKYVAGRKLSFTVSPSGLRYAITRPGTGEVAKIGDTLVVHYKGSLLNGKVFDSSYDRKAPVDFALVEGQTIPGFFEALQLLKKGSRATIVIPSSLAYGDEPNGIIPANSPLVFDLEVVDIIRKPTDEKQADENVVPGSEKTTEAKK